MQPVGRHDLPGVVAVVQVGVEDRHLLVGPRGALRPAAASRQRKKQAAHAMFTRRDLRAPGVVEANRDALAGIARRRHLVAQPALEQDHVARLGRHADERRLWRARRAPSCADSRGSSTFSAPAPFGTCDIIGAADERTSGAGAASAPTPAGMTFSPAIGHGERAAGEIVVQRAGEGLDVRIDAACAGARTPTRRDAAGRASHRTCSRRDSAAPTIRRPAASEAASAWHSSAQRPGRTARQPARASDR